MEADLTRRQQLAWCFGALGVPAMLLCASAAWQWVLVAGACAALYYIIVWRLWVRAGQKPLPGLACEAFGGAGRGVLIAAALWTLAFGIFVLRVGPWLVQPSLARRQPNP